MSDDQLRRRLNRFGLSGKEVDTYLAIVERGEAKTSEIADAADVSRSHVYNIAEELAQRELVEVNDHLAPTTISAKDPDTVVDMLSEDLDAVGEGLRSRFSTPAGDERRFRMIKVRETVLKDLRELVSQGEREVFLTLPARDLPHLREELEAAVDRGVFVGLLLCNPGLEDLGVENLDLAGVANAVRAWEHELALLAVSDEQLGVFGPMDSLSSVRNDSQLLSFLEPQLAPVLVGWFLANYWSGATEVFVADPPSLPRTFEMFRPAAVAAHLHRERGRSVSARITGTWVDGSTEDTVEGEVSAVRQSVVEPASGDLPVEHSITVTTDTRTVTVGGGGSFLEDFAAEVVRLDPA